MAGPTGWISWGWTARSPSSVSTRLASPTSFSSSAFPARCSVAPPGAGCLRCRRFWFGDLRTFGDSATDAGDSPPALARERCLGDGVGLTSDAWWTMKDTPMVGWPHGSTCFVCVPQDITAACEQLRSVCARSANQLQP